MSEQEPAFASNSLFSYVSHDDSPVNVDEPAQVASPLDEIWSEPLAGFGKQSSTQV